MRTRQQNHHLTGHHRSSAKDAMDNADDLSLDMDLEADLSSWKSFAFLRLFLSQIECLHTCTEILM